MLAHRSGIEQPRGGGRSSWVSYRDRAPPRASMPSSARSVMASLPTLVHGSALLNSVSAASSLPIHGYLVHGSALLNGCEGEDLVQLVQICPVPYSVNLTVLRAHTFFLLHSLLLFIEERSWALTKGTGIIDTQHPCRYLSV